MKDPNNRDFITSMESISAGGETIPSFLIISGVNILHKWCQENDLDGRTVLSISDIGYSNDDLAIDWLNHFIEHTQTKRPGAWTLLIIDRCGSHCTIPFFQLAIDNKIVLFRLPSHTTHLTQPLDVGVFQPYKHYHGEAIDHAVRMGDDEFGKLEFLVAFQEFRNKTFKSSTIRHAFRTTNIVPLNPDTVLDVIRQNAAAAAAADAEIPRTPTPPSISFFNRKPKGPRYIENYGRKIQKALDKVRNVGWINRRTSEGIDRFIRGAKVIIAANSLDLTSRDLEQMQTATAAPKSRAKLGGQVASKASVMKVSQCRELCSIRQKKEEEKERRKLERDAKKAEKIQFRDIETLVNFNSIE